MSFTPSEFGLFIDVTGPTILKGPRETVVDAQKTNYETLGYMMRGQRMSDILQGGSKIQDRWLGSVSRRTRSYKMNEEQSYQITNSGETLEVQWRFFLTDAAYPEEALVLNAGSDLSATARAQKYKDYWFALQQDMNVDQMNFWSEQCWAVPSNTDMEASTGQEAYSIPCHLNEFEDGLFGKGNSTFAAGDIWTTKQGIAPGGTGDPDGKWKPTQIAYDNFTANSTGNIITKLDAAFRKTQFKRPPLKAEFFTDAAPWPIGFVACSLDGITKLSSLYRESNDRWDSGFTDPANNPMYNNVPIIYEAELDDAALYPTGSATGALSTESDTSGNSGDTITDALGRTITTGSAGPRFYCVQPDMLRMVWHKDRYMKFLGEMRDASRPTTPILPFNTYGNMVARSQIRHAYIFPSQDA